MPARRVQPSNTSNNLAPQPQHLQQQSGLKPSPSLPAITRSVSPSGLSNFFSRPTKWFTRSNSGSRVSPTEPRTSTSSTTSSRRRPTISGPTDPRPIEPVQPTNIVPSNGSFPVLNERASRSVLDLSRASADLNTTSQRSPGGLGDLRGISRKTWSKSADNLALSPQAKLTPLNTSLETRIELYRAGSPATPVSSSHSNVNLTAYPFPDATGASPSTPPNATIMHAPSNSLSQTSILSPSSRLAPPSPQQIGPHRKRSFDIDRRGKQQEPNAQPARPAFSFYFNSNISSSSKVASPATPTIVEPESEIAGDSKRASQIIHRSGFVLRLQNFSPSSPQLSSSKNWKPFKLVLKGSKLYFYKPPSDRSAAIKELFPSGLVSVVEEEEEEGEEEPAVVFAPPKDERKKRAFWGRRTHPDLVIKDDMIVKGSFEALLHETVFGTTFRAASVDSQGEGKMRDVDDWRNFSSSVLLSLPVLVDRQKFEQEFIRCAGYLINGADESEVESERERIAWLVHRYIKYHVHPADQAYWTSFCEESLPNLSTARDEVDSQPLSPEMNIPNDEIHPLPARSASDGLVLPQPNGNHLQTPSNRSDPLSPARSVRSASRSKLWHALEREGFSREIFLRLEVDTVVNSIIAYHRSILVGRLNLSADIFLEETPNSPLIEFFGSDERPHWLTQMVLSHILGQGHAREGSGSGTAEDRNAAASSSNHNHGSRTHIRSELISKWVRVGELCRHAGDICAWQAVSTALVSKPIARLEKAWKRVDSQALSTIRSWVQALSNGESYIEEAQWTPWGGDLRQRALSILARLHEKKDNEWNYAILRELRQIYEDAEREFTTNCKAQNGLDLSGEEDSLRLMQYWTEFTKKSLPKVMSIDQYMSLSFAAEPRRKGLFSPYFWSHQITSQGQQILSPLLFPEPLPTVSLIDRSQIVRSKKTSLDSGTAFCETPTKSMLEITRTFDGTGNISPRSGLRPRKNGLDFSGMILPVFEGELLLCVSSSSEAGSRPVSAVGDQPPDTPPPNRTPSIRVKSAAAGLDRKSSRARRSSLPPPAHQRSTIMTSEQTSESPLKAVVHAGTLDALVHFLIHGLEGVSVSVADDNGEMALSDKKTRSVKIDRSEFAAIWWNVFRSFVSPYVLFQLLRKDYMTFHPPRNSLSAEELEQALKERLAVIKTVGEWILVGGGAQDALDDPELYSAIRSFLSQNEDRETVSQSEEIRQLVHDISSERASLLRSFTAQTMRPLNRHVPVRGSLNSTAAHNFGIRPPQMEEMTPEDLVNNLDAMASAAFRNVVQEDLFVTADLLEVQTADRTGWFLPRDPSSFADDVEIQTMYSHIIEVEPTPLIGELSGDSLYRLLPPGIRSLIRAYNILRKWTIVNIASPQLGLKTRQSRMELILRAIEVCRLRNADETTVLANANPSERPCVRSFVEAVLTSAIVSPESRMYSRAWQSVAALRGTNPESLLSMLAVRTVDNLENNDRLTVDPSWLIERMLEVISMSDVVDSPIETPLSLVNFEKRRQLCNIIVNASSFAARGSRQRREMDRCDFERLNRIEQEFGDVHLDLRLLRDDAQKEATTQTSSATPSGKRAVRPFNRFVVAQQEKNKRDKYLRERLLKEKRQEQQRLERKEDDLNRAMETRNMMGGVQKQHRSKRSMSAFFSLMRPISTAFSSESTPGQRRTAAELDFPPSSRPAVVLSLAEARISPFINNDRSFTFQLDTEDGGHYLLQALSRNDMNQWISIIGSTVRNHAQRRLTYLGPSAPLQFSDPAQPRPTTASHDPTAVFGVELEFLVARDYGPERTPDAVPKVLELLLREIETRGLTEQGIYRVAGASSEVTALREALNNGQMYIDPLTDIHSVCGVVKYWFRVLPESVVPEEHFDDIINAAMLPDLDERLARVREIIHSFPPAYLAVLKRLMEHLDKVVDYEEKNHMTPVNLSTVFSPNLLRAPGNNFALVMKNMGPITTLFKALITHLHYLFNEVEAEEEDDHMEVDDIPDVQVIPEEEEDQLDDIDGHRIVSSPEPDEILKQESKSDSVPQQE